MEANASIICMKKKINKYRNKKATSLDGEVFDSTKELKRWNELKLLQAGKVISELQRQVVFPIVINGHKVCKYIADFVYIEGEKYVVEDLKSEYTKKLPVYRLKKKLLKAVLDIEILET